MGAVALRRARGRQARREDQTRTSPRDKYLKRGGAAARAARSPSSAPHNHDAAPQTPTGPSSRPRSSF